MKLEIDYDPGFDPPAPVVPATAEGPSGDLVLVPMLIDTGADCTLLPEAVVRRLQLPQVDRMTIAGIAGGRRQAAVHAAWLAFGGVRLLARVVAFESEAILGRDLLAQLVTRLNGPRQKLTLSRPT
jgi:predicted aspartyl protease